MTFKYDPNFDYYSLFEMCMGDGTTEPLEDPESFTEFIQALKDGRYDGESISPAKPAVLAPLTGEELATKLLELKKAGVDSNQEILKATGYWDGKEGTYGQANINFFTAKSKIGETPSLGGIPEPEQLLAMVDELHGINASGSNDVLADLLNELDLDIDPFVLAWSRAKYGKEKDVEQLVEELNEWFDAPDIDLQGKYRQRLLEHIKGACDGNTAWYESHCIGAYTNTLLGGWIDPVREILAEFHEYILTEDVGYLVTEEQYLEVAMSFCETYEQPIEGKMKEYFSRAYYLIGQVTGLDITGYALTFIKRNPEHREALFAAMFEEDPVTGCGGEDGRWETTLLEEPFFSAFKDLIATKCVEMNEYWTQFEDDGVVDYSVWGKDVEELFAAAGINSSPEAQAEIEKQKQHKEMIAEEARKSKAIGEIEAAEAAEERKKEKARKDARSDQEVWEEALEVYYIDACLTECDRFRSFIEKDIDEIKDIHSDGNPAILINPPAWLVSLFKANDVEFEGGDITEETINFDGLRVCVTGKLSKTRKEIEEALEAAGAEIASAVTKTTDLLVVGKDAGSKLQKAKELGTKILTEAELDEALSND